jgi:tetratricopeptide (TPR) repeat protein
LIYFETENYEKAEIAFESALKLEDQLAARHIAYAKVLEKNKKTDAALKALEKAVELEPLPQTFQLLADMYVALGRNDEAAEVLSKKGRLIIPAGKPASVKQSRRVVY